MKKIISLSVALVAASASYAQPKLNTHTSSPVPGDRFYSRSCVKTGVSKGASGANVIWDFSKLLPINMDMDSVKYTTCDSTPFCDSISYASLATPVNSGWGYNYYTADTNGFRVLGNIRPGQSWGYSGYADVLPYPISYGTVRVDTFSKTQPALGNSCYQVDSFVADAYGTILLPFVKFDSVLRVHVFARCNDVNYTPGHPSTSASYKKEEYRWYVAGFHSPLLVLQYDPNLGSTPVLSNVLYYTHSKKATGINDVENNIADLAVAPNPATNSVHIKMTITTAGPVMVAATDMLGRTVGIPDTKYMHTGPADVVYDLSSVPTGMYIIRVQTADGTAAQKVQVIK